MNENDPILDNHEPSWATDGYDILGEQRDFQDEDNTPWETNSETYGAHIEDNPGRGGRGLTVSDGTTVVAGVVYLLFDGTVFDVVDAGSGEADVNCV